MAVLPRIEKYPLTTLAQENFSGRTYWVKLSTDSDYVAWKNRWNIQYDNGSESVHTTLALAIAAASAYDRIFVTSGVHTQAAKHTIEKAGLKIIGTATSMFHQPCNIKMLAATASDVFLIKADRVEIGNLLIQQRGAYKGIAIGDTAGQAYYQTHIHDCAFDAYSTGLYGIAPGNSGDAAISMVDAVNLVVENCYFQGWVTAAILANGTRDAYHHNFIMVPAAGIGIDYNKHTASRAPGYVCDNTILGANSTDTGIKITTDPSAGGWVCARNWIAGCSTSITTSTNNLYNSIFNYAASAAGGAQIDTAT